MTHRPIRVQEDGTRVYASYHRYKPLSDEERKYARRQPDDPRAVRWGGQWFLPLEVLPEAERVMPATRPDSDAYEHMSQSLTCACEVCLRPAAERWRRRWRRDHGLRRG